MTEKTEPKFEDAIARLEGIAEKLESGEMTLDESLKLYEEGVRLSQTCAKRLEHAEKRIEVLMRSNDGSLKTEEADEELKPRKKKGK
ncbi:MAG: exodeoxyribonuclease VII small subunit [Candidatus Omnitrophica bacterium]|nr:exodeoxyribonuclease VII small subunit [Candidatus Omnitrophota bacterium]